MVEIDFKDLCVFEQLLKEKCERLSKGLKMIESSPNTHLIDSFKSDLFFYSSLYDDVVDKLLELGFKK